MRNSITIFIICFIAVSCGKDKYTSAPQITFKSVKPNQVLSNVTSPYDPSVPFITINVTDAEGDFGDTAYVYVKRIINNVPHYKLDSFRMPNISAIAGKNFQADIRINSYDILRGDSTRPHRPKVDTLNFELYVKDLAKNKSNVIITNDPIYYVTP